MTIWWFSIEVGVLKLYYGQLVVFFFLKYHFGCSLINVDSTFLFSIPIRPTKCVWIDKWPKKKWRLKNNGLQQFDFPVDVARPEQGPTCVCRRPSKDFKSKTSGDWQGKTPPTSWTIFYLENGNARKSWNRKMNKDVQTVIGWDS